ncbi:Uncharacterized protein Rs2_09766 [Raphanus sativus]|nr:Uncharacterized protein Rs2_09766 [Raphanus sativus]
MAKELLLMRVRLTLLTSKPLPRKQEHQGVKVEELLYWRKATKKLILPFQLKLQYHSQKPPTKRPTSQLVCEEVHQNQVLKDQQLRAKQKKEGKRPVVEESDSEKAEDPSPDSDEDHGPPKRKNFNAGRDMKKKPT